MESAISTKVASLAAKAAASPEPTPPEPTPPTAAMTEAASAEGAGGSTPVAGTAAAAEAAAVPKVEVTKGEAAAMGGASAAKPAAAADSRGLVGAVDNDGDAVSPEDVEWERQQVRAHLIGHLKGRPGPDVTPSLAGQRRRVGMESP